jgi:transcriptional regulator GlxA family with amidase domain
VPVEPLDPHDVRTHAAHPQSTRMRAPCRPVVGDRGAEATSSHAGRTRRPYVYDARKERPMRGVRNRMEAVRETLDTRYFLDVDCRSLAESAGMSHYHFIRVFRAMYGTSPHQYLTRTRVEAAKRLLLGSTEPIEVIAVGVGFRSGPSMSRAFKRIEGASASRYFQATHRFPANAATPAAAPEPH